MIEHQIDTDAISEMYMDGRLAKEIEHILVLRLHTLNTIEEIEWLKSRIHGLMENTYNKGLDRVDAER